MKTSIVIPCYNEREAIRDTIEQLIGTIHESNLQDVDIITVNDGSTDGSEQVLNALQDEYKSQGLTVLHHRRNQGYGAALKS